MKRTVILLGSTGSIGRSAVRVLRELKEGFKVYGLSCCENLSLLEEQIRELGPAAVSVASPAARASLEYRELKERFPDIEFIEDPEPVTALAGREADITLSAVVGSAGLLPSLAAIGSAKRIALANKETLVMAGDLFMERAAASGTEIIPVDSEHSAVFSLMNNIAPSQELKRILLTASGGSLRDMPVSRLKTASPAEVLKHPTWSMGSKITVDSATMMNKGFEVIEAHHLFKIPYEKIDVTLHPESLVHSMIETVDGAVYAHMGTADMALPIMNAFCYPHRQSNGFGRLDFTKELNLRFMPWDPARYPALPLCYKAGKAGGTLPAALNGANEAAVKAFLEGKILFTDIQYIVEKAVSAHRPVYNPGLEDILEADRQAREISDKNIRSIR